jgi:hypothetical protein
MEVGDKRERKKLSGKQKGERGVEPDQEWKHATTTEREEKERPKGEGIGFSVDAMQESDQVLGFNIQLWYRSPNILWPTLEC